jgi:hypothetical protein
MAKDKSKFEVSEPTTKLAMPGSIRGTVRDKRAGGLSYQWFADVVTRKVTMIYEITGGDPAMPNVRCIDQSSVGRIKREVEQAIAL